MIAAFEPIQRAMVTLMRELIDGTEADAAWVLNPGDRGLLTSLDAISAVAASASHEGRSSIVAHVDHLRYGLELLNRWSRGENPFADADYSASWRRQRVSDAEWRDLQTSVAREAHSWLAVLTRPREWDDVGLTGALASVAHLAYHLGAIRQIDPATVGPKAKD
jgi:hypothetical protein